MEEILYELKEHAAGLNAGRWDYIFSCIKKFATTAPIFPDRAQVTMTVPFMKAYTELLVKSCHIHEAHAIGGMAAFIPSRKDPQVNERAFQQVRADKEREASQGFDGTWVAHPDLVPVAMEVFDRYLGDKPHQKHVKREDVHVTAADLLNFHVPEEGDGGGASQQHLRGPPVPEPVALGQRGRGHLQPHGGRRHRRDQPGPALAVGAPGAQLEDGRPVTPTSTRRSRRRSSPSSAAGTRSATGRPRRSWTSSSSPRSSWSS